MASIRITQFAGLLPNVSARLKPAQNAQVAHNCLLWDGTLRPQAHWTLVETITTTTEDIRSIAYNPSSDLPVMYWSHDATSVVGPPFSSQTTIGAGPASILSRYYTGVGNAPQPAAVYNTGIGGSVVWAPAHASTKPTNRLYGVTRVRRINDKAEEGSLTILPNQDPSAITYEGDTATISIAVVEFDDALTHVRLYRTISGLETGETIANTLDTEWHLIDEIAVGSAAPSGFFVTYIDGGSATTDPLDVYYSNQFYPPPVPSRYFGLTDSGWFVVAGESGDVAVSERFLHHAWPVDNRFSTHTSTTDMAVSGDNVYLGTRDRPYIMAVSFGEKAMQASLTAFHEPYPCLPNTMTPTPSGAVYASNIGVVALSKDGQQVITAGLTNAGDVLYRYTRVSDEVVGEVRIDNTTFGVYDSGWYYAFNASPPRAEFFF